MPHIGKTKRLAPKLVEKGVGYEHAHLSEVVVPLLQPGELSEQTLVLPPLLIQLCCQSFTFLGHSLHYTLWMYRHNTSDYKEN